MKKLALLGALAATLGPMLAPTPSYSQSVEPVEAVKPLRAVRTALGVSYPEGAKIAIDFAPTERAPEAEGKAKVERERGETDIKIKLDDLKPATYFGGDYSAYVLWIASPEGHIDNAGELIVRGDEASLNVSTPLQTFGMFVTAEPHFLVSSPSEFVVLQTARPHNEVTGQMLKGSTIKYKGYDGIYAANVESLRGVPEQKGEVRTDMKQARVAVALAKRARADEFAPDRLAEAQAKLDQLINAVEGHAGDNVVMTMGHEVVRLAVDAQKTAEERAFQAALDAERKSHADEINSLETSIGEAKTEAERAKLLAEQRQMKIEMEQSARDQAMAEAREAAERAAKEAHMRQVAEAEARLAEQRAMRLQGEKSAAEEAALAAKREAEQALAEREEARQRMRAALETVVETRETARGVIVNLPDILFDFDKAALRPEARETLSRVCGIFLIVQGYDLSVEGHTDSVGSDEYNQKLSEQRAGSVKNYLDSCELKKQITAKGFGETQPIASNDTNDGRQKNRRVEIVIQENENFEVSGGLH